MASSEDLSGDIEEVKKAMQTGNLVLAAVKAKNVLEKKKNITIAIAITGETGSGKSTLVNTLRGVSDDEEAAAPVGEVETTMEPKQYSYPNNPKITIWDLPGIGTSKFPADQYLKKMGFEKFDFFIIVSETRFRENDAKLALEIQKMKKKFYFIRSKIDSNISAAERRKKDKDQTLQEIRQDCIQNLKELKIESPKVFLVSAPELHSYDFPLLCETLEKNLPELQRDALLLALPNISLDVIEKKKKELQKQILLNAVMSAVGAVVPIPVLSAAVDVMIIVSFTKECQDSFGLSPAALQNLSRLSGVPLEELMEELKSSLAGKQIIAEHIIRFLTSSAVKITSTAAEEVIRFIPVVGTAEAVGLSYKTTVKVLNYILNTLSEDAQTVYTRALRE